MIVPQYVITEAFDKWRLSGNTRILTTKRACLVIPKILNLSFGEMRKRRQIAENLWHNWFKYTKEERRILIEASETFEGIRFEPEPLIDNWDAAYNPDEDIAVFRCRE